MAVTHGIRAFDQIIAAKGGWVWKRVAALEPGDVQIMAGRHMHVAKVVGYGREVVIYYDDSQPRAWGKGTEVGVLPDEFKSTVRNDRMEPMTEDEILREADRRFHMDAVFHARVEATAIILSTRNNLLTGTRLDPSDMDLARHAASVALILADLNPVNGGALWE